ncbi:Tol-Pal system beta propeller repeat protein TolB [Alphaproteobacteria bacterium]|nr:Tol-Pal system beta propeller repeat protein TolB [Alphaproteobacteria bacterium]
MKYINLILLCLITFKVQALELTLNQGTVKPTPIAVTNLFSNNTTLDKLGKNISSVISDNLERSGLFNAINQKAFIQSSESLSNQPRFEDWKIIKAQHLVSGKIESNNNNISIEFRLFDVFAQKQIVGKKYETSKNNWRRVAHIISDAIFQRITGEGGFFDTRIVYVAETGPKDNRQKRLAIMDQDQANHRFLTDGSYLVLTPRFSPNSQKITYMSYVKANSPRVFIFDIETGQQEIVGEFPGMTFAPRFSPDGKKIVMSYSDPDVGNSEIYILDIQTRTSKRVTNNSSIDVSGSFSPDGEKIVFNSDRTGRRHLYIIDSDGENLKRISREAGSYYTPVWSPRGDMIAFTKQEGGQFYIGVMETNGSNERMIAKSFHVEGPTWSPNGRYLMYFKEERTSSDGSGGESSLYSIDLTGYNERKIITPLGGSDPAWSPLMH